MWKNALIMQKRHWIMRKFQQLTKMILKSSEFTEQQWKKEHLLRFFQALNSLFCVQNSFLHSMNIGAQ